MGWLMDGNGGLIKRGAQKFLLNDGRQDERLADYFGETR
jgi:hypothetical protein